MHQVSSVPCYDPDSEYSTVDKLKVDGATSISLSPGLNPSVAIFVAEKKVRPLPSAFPTSS